MRPAMADLLSRSIRTLAWLGDVEFEREVRHRLAQRGDYPTDRLDAMKTRIVRATAQAELLDEIRPQLSEDELALVQRGRNAAPPAGARKGRQGMAEYRAATALEVLVAAWCVGPVEGRARFEEVLAGPLERAIDRALKSHGRRVRRG